MKDIRDVLFSKYTEEVESSEPTKADNVFSYVLCELEGIDDQLFHKVICAATDVINEQMERAYRAGFSAAVAARRAIDG